MNYKCICLFLLNCTYLKHRWDDPLHFPDEKAVANNFREAVTSIDLEAK